MIFPDESDGWSNVTDKMKLQCSIALTKAFRKAFKLGVSSERFRWVAENELEVSDFEGMWSRLYLQAAFSKNWLADYNQRCAKELAKKNKPVVSARQRGAL